MFQGLLTRTAHAGMELKKKGLTERFSFGHFNLIISRVVKYFLFGGGRVNLPRLKRIFLGYLENPLYCEETFFSKFF
jgi:hypothetical protein